MHASKIRYFGLRLLDGVYFLFYLLKKAFYSLLYIMQMTKAFGPFCDTFLLRGKRPFALFVPFKVSTLCTYNIDT